VAHAHFGFDWILQSELTQVFDFAGTFLNDDIEKIESATKELMEKIQPIGTKMYEEAAKEAETEKDSEEKSSKGKKTKTTIKEDEAVEGEVVDDKE
jgi:hypothetical protein